MTRVLNCLLFFLSCTLLCLLISCCESFNVPISALSSPNRISDSGAMRKDSERGNANVNGVGHCANSRFQMGSRLNKVGKLRAGTWTSGSEHSRRQSLPALHAMSTGPRDMSSALVVPSYAARVRFPQQENAFLKDFLAWYTQKVHENPLKTKMLTSGTIFSLIQPLCTNQCHYVCIPCGYLYRSDRSCW
jgi:hypothetical protein